jgi:hypothetical protein
MPLARDEFAAGTGGVEAVRSRLGSARAASVGLNHLMSAEQVGGNPPAAGPRPCVAAFAAAGHDSSPRASYPAAFAIDPDFDDPGVLRVLCSVERNIIRDTVGRG